MMGVPPKVFLSTLLYCLLFYLLFVASLYLSQRKFIYIPDPHEQMLSVYNAEDMRVVKVPTQDGLELSAWYKAPSEGKPVIVVFHGNASHMGMSAWKVRGYIDQGYGALLPAYRGYAGNPGKPTEPGLYEDARSIVRWLLSEQGVREEGIVLLGESLGSGVAVELAAHEFQNVKGVILESPYTSFIAMAQRNYFFVPFVGYLVKDKYKSIDKIADVKAPLLIVHGQKDIIVPYQFGKQLFDAANQPKEMVTLPMAGHNDLYMHGAGQHILHFLSGLK